MEMRLLPARGRSAFYRYQSVITAKWVLFADLGRVAHPTVFGVDEHAYLGSVGSLSTSDELLQ